MKLADLFKRYEFRCITQHSDGFHVSLRDTLDIHSGATADEAMLKAVVAYEQRKYPDRVISWNAPLGYWVMTSPYNTQMGMDLGLMYKQTAGPVPYKAWRLKLDLDDLDDQEKNVRVNGKLVTGVKEFNTHIELETE